MSRSAALSPQFGSAVVFGSGFAGRRRRAKSVRLPLPEGMRVVAVCVPDEVDEAPRSRAARSAPHRTNAARRPRATSHGRPAASRITPPAAPEVDAGPTAGGAPFDRPATARGPAASRPAAAAVTARRPQQARLRLTRRGQIVVTLVVTALLLAVFSLGRFSAGAASDPVPHRIVTVHSGDTLWSIAARVAPSADPRVTVEKIRLLNHLDSGGVQVGQQLQLP